MASMVKFNLGQTRVNGFRVDSAGNVHDFSGTLKRTYNSVARASIAARRKYGDNTITVTEVIPESNRYQVSEEELLKIATPID